MMRLKLEIGRSLYGAGYGIISPGGGGTAWSPAALFASGEQGVWYDPSDFSAMFQDSAGTTPVTAVGQPVGKILDKSGRGNHAAQSTAAARPVLQQDGNGKYYLAFDGVDDFMKTGNIDFSSTNNMTIVAGLRKMNDSASIVAELSSDVSTNAGTFYLVTGTDSGVTGYSSLARGSAAITVPQLAKAGTYAGNDLAVVSATHDIPGDVSAIRRNGVAGVSGTADKGAGNFGNYPLYIGRRGGTTLPLLGNIYQLIVRGAATADLVPVETFVNSKTGAY